jgi:hypothetical protein
MKRLVFITFILTVTRTFGQEYPRNETDINEIVEALAALPDMDLNYEDLYENLVQLMAHPLDLNKASEDDLRFLKILSELQISTLIKHREENEAFISVYELQAVPEFDLQTIYRLASFVTVNDAARKIDASLLRRIKKESDNYFLTRYERTIQTKNGFKETAEEGSRFKGTPDKIYMRFRSSSPGDFSFGFTAEKDPGEPVKWNPSARYYGADYLSYHLQLQNKGRLRNLVIGDYQTQFGQGLVFGGVFGMGKGGETITSLRRSNIGVLPYTSAYETGALHGIAITMEGPKNLTFTSFYSNAKKDATVDPGDEQNLISAFQSTGMHRNDNEISKRRVLGERNFGGVIQYKHNAMDAGLMFSQTSFDGFVQPRPLAYNQFAFSGTQNRNIGLYVNYTLRNVSLFGEAARSLRGGYAVTAGLLTSLAPMLDLSILYRRFDRNYYSFYSSGFGETSNTQNEQGLYWGWKYTFSRRYSIAGYVDFFKFQWLRFRGYAPSTGYEWLLRFNYDPSRKVKIFIQAREEVKTRNIELDSINQYIVEAGKKNNYWLSFDYSPHQMLRLKSRAQFSTYNINGKTTEGFAMMYDLICNIGKLKISMRYALFETEDYDNRQYAYENDVWLAFSLPAYDGSGIRKIIVCSYKLNKHVNLSIRYAHTRYQNKESIGTSVDQIEGDTKNDIKAQLVIRF